MIEERWSGTYTIIHDLAGRFHAFVWNKASGTQTIGPKEGDSSADALNNLGHVLISTSYNGRFILRQGQLTPLQLSKQENALYAMNDHDQVVGAFGPFSDAYHAFLWDPEL